MFNDRLNELISNYNLEFIDDYEQAFKEVMQKIILCGLSRTDFFNNVAFTGGTCLRIFHGLNRYSEDLDFSLKTPDDNFDFKKYSDSIRTELRSNGIDAEFSVKPKSSAVKSAFVKANTYTMLMSIPTLDNSRFTVPKSEKTRIKLEIDTNPPEGANFENVTSEVPEIFIATAMDKESMFALKIHAILSRPYIKGRDYYDYLWYMENDTKINLNLLRNALVQTGGMQYSNLTFTQAKDLLKQKFKTADIVEVSEDVSSFLDNQDDINLVTRENLMNSLNKKCFKKKSLIEELKHDKELVNHENNNFHHNDGAR